jgi:hypothetical protein
MRDLMGGRQNRRVLGAQRLSSSCGWIGGPKFHNTNPPGVFDGVPYELRDSSDDVKTRHGLDPGEKTIRRRFENLQKAIEHAGVN